MKTRISPGDSARRSSKAETRPVMSGLAVEPCPAGPAAACGDDGEDCSDLSSDTCVRDGLPPTCAWVCPAEAGARGRLCQSGVISSKVWLDTSSNAEVSSCAAGSALALHAAVADAPRG